LPASAARFPARCLLNGKPIDLTGNADPAALRQRGLAHVPEDRHHVGLVLKFEESENAILGYHNDPLSAKARCSTSMRSAADAKDKIAL
jgi:ABC-type uncharacterized transport system ATPase subunit